RWLFTRGREERVTPSAAGVCEGRFGLVNSPSLPPARARRRGGATSSGGGRLPVLSTSSTRPQRQAVGRPNALAAGSGVFRARTDTISRWAGGLSGSNG